MKKETCMSVHDMFLRNLCIRGCIGIVVFQKRETFRPDNTMMVSFTTMAHT